MRVIDLALKDLYQIVQDWKAALFLVIMPVAFTLLFGGLFSGTDGETDPRLPVGVLNLDAGEYLSEQLITLLDTSSVIRPVMWEEDDDATSTTQALAQQVADEELVAALIVPGGYSERVRGGETVKLRVIVEDNTNVGHTAHVETRAMVNRLLNAVQTARLTVSTLTEANPEYYEQESARAADFEVAVTEAVSAWKTPPFTVRTTSTGQEGTEDAETNDFVHSSAGMMAQFAIAGLIGAAEVVVAERKSRTLQRLLTTALTRAQIIAGHFLAMFVMVFVQLLLLAVFGDILGVGYFRAPLASLLMLGAFAFFTGAMGMLIGALAKSEEQVIVFSLLPMFILSGLGGAWMPLEYTPEAFQTVAHFLPVAWAVDGLKNITLRGLGIVSVLQPAAVLLGFGLLCLILSAWLFRVE